MNHSIEWTEQHEPVGQSLDQLIYRIRQSDSAEGLIFDSARMADILSEDGVELLAFDALVFSYSLLRRKMDILLRTMNRAGGDVDVSDLQISDPFKRNGVAQVAAVFELSDGQTVSVYFHNPDSTPGKLTPTDEMISWKWLLNKKDITIVVAPERGNDIAIREVARRIMKLAGKNSAAFAKNNAKRAERLENISNMKEEITSLEAELGDINRQIEVRRVEIEGEQLKPQLTTSDGLSALESIKAFISRGQYRTISKAMRGEEKKFFIDKARLLADIINGMAEIYDQDGKGMDATAYLHYFTGSSNWYITEKDSQGGTRQAFGYANLGQGQDGDLGYVSIDELTKGEVELDLYFEPKALSAIVGKEEEPASQGPDQGPDASKIMAEVRTMVVTVAGEFGGVVSEWDHAEGATSPWDYAYLSVSGLSLRVGVSSGGVVSIDGKPHDQEGRVIDSQDSLRAAISALLPVQEQAWELDKESVTAMDEDQFQREINELEESNLRNQSVLMLAKRKGTDEQISEAQSILDEYDQLGHAPPELIERREVLRSAIGQEKAAPTEDTEQDRALSAAREGTEANLTDEQKESGDYQKGELKAFGLVLAIENPKGHVRSGKGEGGTEWSVSMAHDYGYIKGTKGLDGDEVDAFIGPNLDSETAYVIEQVDQSGKMDEHKVMLGFNDEAGASQGYLSSYKPGWSGLGSIKAMSLDELKAWLPTVANTAASADDQGSNSGDGSPIEPGGVSVGDTVVWRNEFGALEGNFRGFMDGNQMAMLVIGGSQMAAPVGEVYHQANADPVIEPELPDEPENSTDPIVDNEPTDQAPQSDNSIAEALDTILAAYQSGRYFEIMKPQVKDAVKLVTSKLGTHDEYKFATKLKSEYPEVIAEAVDEARKTLVGEPQQSEQPTPEHELNQDPTPTEVPAQEVEPVTVEPEQPAQAGESQMDQLNALKKLAPKTGEAVRSDDPDAIAKLEAKLNYLQSLAQMMRDANKHVRKDDVESLAAMGFNDKTIQALSTPDNSGRKGFAQYQMANNSSEVGRTKRRLKQLYREQEAEAMAIASEPVEPTIEAEPAAEPIIDAVPEEVTVANDDVAFLESVANGTVADMLSPELGEQITAALERNIENESMAELLERAVMAYQSAAELATSDI